MANLSKDPSSPAPAYAELWRSWEAQQEGYIPSRNERFEVMLDLLEALPGPKRAFVDAGCGTGSLSRRLLDRFPKARVYAVDLDPVLLEIGRRTLRSYGARLQWVEADLREMGWTHALGGRRPDAIVSTTALHWLAPRSLARTYSGFQTLLRPGGLFLNGDHTPDPSRKSSPQLARLVARAHEERERRSFQRTGGEHWRAWWGGLAKDPRFQTLLETRAQRYGRSADHEHDLSLSFHLTALRRAGFAEASEVWRELWTTIIAAKKRG